jgi:predicted NBD/HSP70 family sugar kinase
MLSNTKKSRRRAQLKQLILRNGSVTRAEAVQKLDFDVRTATAYLEKLCGQGFCRREKEEPDGKGRPGIIYRDNTENMFFVGILIRAGNTVELIATDINGEVLKAENWELNIDLSKLTVFNSILSKINGIADSFPGKVLGGIGLAVSRWLQPPLAAYDLYSGLAKFLEKQTGLDVYRTVNINALAYDVACRYGLRDVIILHPGNVIELGIIQDGRSIQNYAEHENTLAHLAVDKRGQKCYCGKRGCLENYVTNSAIIEKLRELAPGMEPSKLNLNMLEAEKLKKKIVDYLVEACKYLAQTYKPQKIFLMGNATVADKVIMECRGEKLKCGVDTILKGSFSVVKGAAVMAAFMAVKQYK